MGCPACGGQGKEHTCTETVSIIDFKRLSEASGRRGREAGSAAYWTFGEWMSCYSDENVVPVRFIDARFELEPEPVKLPEGERCPKCKRPFALIEFHHPTFEGTVEVCHYKSIFDLMSACMRVTK